MELGESKRSSTNLEEIRAVSFCDLVSHPELYADKVVRVQVTYLSTFESNVLYDPKCVDRENYVWPMFDCGADQSCKAMRKRLDKSLKGDPFSGMRSELLIVGRLKGPKPSFRYGVQSGCRLGFSIERIERARPLPSHSRVLGSKANSASSWPIWEA